MPYKIEMKYWHGWDDAFWTEEKDGNTKPLRFLTIRSAQKAIDEYLSDVKTAVAAGDMDTTDCGSNYRSVAG